MKKFLSLLLTLLTFTVISASAQATLKFEKTTHDFGTFEESQAQTVVFKFTNTGDSPLVIHQAFSSCGCTVANYTKEPVRPGDSGEVRVTYNGRGKFPGKFKKSVTIRSNATNNLARIYIQGDMTANTKK